MKKFLTFMAAFFGGAAASMLLAMGAISLYEDVPLTDLLREADPDFYISCFVALVAGLVGFLLHVVAHECGHLVGGLMSGYRFVSFRILGLALLRQDGHWRLKRFSLLGTGGQCLMAPPAGMSDQDVSTTLYNLGGIIATTLLTLLLVAAAIAIGDVWARQACIVMASVGFCLLVMNAIPMGANDAANELKMRQPATRRRLLNMLRVNAAIQEGTMLADVPAEWLDEPEQPVDYRNMIAVNSQLFWLSVLLCRGEVERAYEGLKDYCSHKKEMIKLLYLEGRCELLYCAAVTGRTDEAAELMADKQLMDYIEQNKAHSTSKLRVLFAIELLIHGDAESARRIMNDLEANLDRYLSQGEAKTDLAIMRELKRS